MKLKKVAHGKSSAQAMVEFAIALPILLMLLYGILEAGRLLFIYSSVVTASRQAVRYGSATGVGTSGVLRYRDCAGIRASAQRADFLNAFDDSDILIYHDDGPDPSNPGNGLNKTLYCTGTIDSSFSPTNSSRIVVEIAGDFYPIIPRLVPFIERSASSSSGPIMGESARTILVSIDIVVTAPPGTFQPSTATFTFTPSPTPSPTRTRTPTPTFTFTPVFTNTSSRTPTATIPPTVTRSPTATTIPTITQTPTGLASPISCPITHGAITLSSNTMRMTLNSTAPIAVTIQDIFVVWNHDKGHQTGSDKTLKLNTVTLGSQLWTGVSNGPSVTIDPATTATIPVGASTIIFTFHQTYDNLDGTEQILINISNPGCSPVQAP